ncbi:hypothetical protein SAMN05421753_10969 [Planctomicrobium piriforme]|uniref:Uncharacterized protein n=1 Tax=Planctomicrobium piriforme TaxID=1576369 RepID=A0A1I3ID98_9PLAN|nr:hypothetical protein [Planctomicrobium piriforme]SFI45849.1 hypothetical protein SAMN05421753_10969 [Planctomicrobium piriforme]
MLLAQQSRPAEQLRNIAVEFWQFGITWQDLTSGIQNGLVVAAINRDRLEVWIGDPDLFHACGQEQSDPVGDGLESVSRRKNFHSEDGRSVEIGLIVGASDMVLPVEAGDIESNDGFGIKIQPAASFSASYGPDEMRLIVQPVEQSTTDAGNCFGMLGTTGCHSGLLPDFPSDQFQVDIIWSVAFQLQKLVK